MSFWPLAKSCPERARALAGLGRVVEVGAGEGAFASRLASLGVTPLLVEPRPTPAIGAWPQVRAASPRLPLRQGSCGLLVLANTFRHLDPAARPSHAEEWGRCLAVGGELWILEDEPAAGTPAARNYRHCLELLARADRGRGSALPAAEARAAVDPVLGAAVEEHRGPNRTPVQDPLGAVRWLRAHEAAPVDDLDALERSIHQGGLEYGDYWHQVWRR